MCWYGLDYTAALLVAYLLLETKLVLNMKNCTKSLPIRYLIYIYIYYNLNINKGQLEKLVALKPLISKKMMKEPSLESAC